MSEALRQRNLSNGDIFVFNHHTKDIYLISKAKKKYWTASKKTEAALKAMVTAGQATFFPKAVLAKIAAALNSIALAKIAGINL